MADFVCPGKRQGRAIQFNTLKAKDYNDFDGMQDYCDSGQYEEDIKDFDGLDISSGGASGFTVSFSASSATACHLRLLTGAKSASIAVWRPS